MTPYAEAVFLWVALMEAIKAVTDPSPDISNIGLGAGVQAPG